METAVVPLMVCCWVITLPNSVLPLMEWFVLVGLKIATLLACPAVPPHWVFAPYIQVRLVLGEVGAMEQTLVSPSGSLVWLPFAVLLSMWLPWEADTLGACAPGK